ncbi:unnamed protein product, partial [Hapterophycus canaliculatus]
SGYHASRRSCYVSKKQLSIIASGRLELRKITGQGFGCWLRCQDVLSVVLCGTLLGRKRRREMMGVACHEDTVLVSRSYPLNSMKLSGIIMVCSTLGMKMPRTFLWTQG